MVVGAQATVISGVNALVTFGTGVSSTTTTNGGSASGQKVLTTNATAGFVVGQTVVINPGGGDQETAIINSVQAGVSLTMLSNLQNPHLTAETVNQYYSLYGMAQTFTFNSGNKQNEEEVIGTDIPIIVTGAYHGDFKMSILYSTESTNSAQFQTLLQPANGQVGPVNLIITGHDASNSMRAFTWLGQVWPSKNTFSENGTGKIMSDMEGVFNARAIAT